MFKHTELKGIKEEKDQLEDYEKQHPTLSPGVEEVSAGFSKDSKGFLRSCCSFSCLFSQLITVGIDLTIKVQPKCQ